MRLIGTLFLLLWASACLTPDTSGGDVTAASPDEEKKPMPSTDVNLEIADNPNANVAGMSLFTKYIEVLGLGIYAEANVADAHVLHAAHILAELLDNDENGEVDDQALWAKLLSQEALVPMFNAEGSPAENEFFNNYRGHGVGAVLYNGEIDPAQPGHWGLMPRSRKLCTPLTLWVTEKSTLMLLKLNRTLLY